MLPKVKPFDRANVPSSVQAATSMATTSTVTLYVYETNDINADPQANTGHLVTLHLTEGAPTEILYRLAQQFPGARCFVHSLEGEEFQGWKEVTEKNVKNIGENLRVRNQMKVVKPSILSLAFHESGLMDRMVSAIVGKLKKEITISQSPSINEEDNAVNMMDDATFGVHPVTTEEVAVLVEPERLCLTEESFGNKNWAKVRERARGVLHLEYP